MYIIIVGAGEVGSYLARILVEEQHDVVVLETNEKVARELESRMDALVIHGNGVSAESLKQARIDKADLVLAVTRIDEVNLVSCMIAARLGRSPQTVARVRAVEYLAGSGPLPTDELGLSHIVGPERAVAAEVVEHLTYEGSGEAHRLLDGRLVLLELPLTVDSPLAVETISELRAELPQPSLVAAIGGKQGLRIPRGHDRMAPDERAYILTTPDNVDSFWILSGTPWHHVRHVLIIGCGTIGFQLAKRLEAESLYPTIIEVQRERAEWVARRLQHAIVLHGDGTDAEFLQEQLQERADAVVVLLEDDEKALLIGLFAKHLGAKKVIVRSDKSAYAPIAHRLGIDALISPRLAVAEDILRFVRGKNVASTHMLGDHEGEILELTVPDGPVNSEILEHPLRELDFPEGALVGAVIRGDEVFLADGKTQLRQGDRLLVVSLPSVVPRVEKLLR